MGLYSPLRFVRVPAGLPSIARKGLWDLKEARLLGLLITYPSSCVELKVLPAAEMRSMHLGIRRVKGRVGRSNMMSLGTKPSSWHLMVLSCSVFLFSITLANDYNSA